MPPLIFEKTSGLEQFFGLFGTVVHKTALDLLYQVQYAARLI